MREVSLLVFLLLNCVQICARKRHRLVSDEWHAAEVKGPPPDL